MRLFRRMALVAVLLAAGTCLARAVPVDGVLDPDYGTALATQTTQTSFGDWPVARDSYGELDAAYGYVANDTLRLFIAGNFNRFISEPLIFANQLQLFFDTQPGGQDVLSAANPSVGYYVDLEGTSGLAFDADFAPDYWLGGSRDGHERFFAYYAELPAGGGGAGYFLGASSTTSDGALTAYAGSNPFGILAAVDVSNTAGVGAGCDAALGAGVTAGAEWAIPLAALGRPPGPIRICALLARLTGSSGNLVANQVLGPVPPGTCSLGLASTVNLENVPGAQYFVVDQSTPAARSSWGRIKAAYR